MFLKIVAVYPLRWYNASNLNFIPIPFQVTAVVPFAVVAYYSESMRFLQQNGRLLIADGHFEWGNITGSGQSLPHGSP